MTSLNPIMTVGRQIYETIRRHRMISPKKAKELIFDLFREVGIDQLPNVYERYPHELSGGQQQRVMIAMALSGDPELLIADEPTTALDITVQSQIINLLLKLQRSRGMSMLFISHDLGVISHVAHEVAIMRAGKIIEYGPTKEILESPVEPYTKALMQCRPPLMTKVKRLTTLSQGSETPFALPVKGFDPNQGNTILEVRNLYVTYPGKGWDSKPFTAVKDLSFMLKQNQTLGVVGESGSGKSTLAKAIAGLIPFGRGKVIFEGQALSNKGKLPRSHYRKMQYIFQDSYGALNPRHNVSRLIGEPLDIHKLETGDQRQSALIRLLDEVGLEEFYLERYPQELSGGQRQRINIARALALGPDLIICDEIVSALDVSIQAQVLNLLKDIQEQRNLSLIFISHDLAVVRFLADHIIVMHEGQIVEWGETDAIIDNPSHPYTQKLINAVKKFEIIRPKIREKIMV